MGLIIDLLYSTAGPGARPARFCQSYRATRVPGSISEGSQRSHQLTKVHTFTRSRPRRLQYHLGPSLGPSALRSSSWSALSQLWLDSFRTGLAAIAWAIVQELTYRFPKYYSQGQFRARPPGQHSLPAFLIAVSLITDEMVKGAEVATVLHLATPNASTDYGQHFVVLSSRGVSNYG